MNSVLLIGLLLLRRPPSDLLVEDLLRGRDEFVEPDSSIRLELVDGRSLILRSSSFSSSVPLLDLLGGGGLSWSGRRVGRGLGGGGSVVGSGGRGSGGGRSDGRCSSVSSSSVGGGRGGGRRGRCGGGSVRGSVGDERRDGSVRSSLDVLFVFLSSGSNLDTEIVPVFEGKKSDGSGMLGFGLSDLLEAENGVEG